MEDSPFNSKEFLKAEEILDKYWAKGHKERGNAMVLLAMAYMAGRSDGKFIEQNLNRRKK